MEISRVSCSQCDTQIESILPTPTINMLPDELMEFVLTFLRCRGNIKEVERELGISYPTVRSRLDKVIERLGVGDDPARMNQREILASLDREEMTPEDAVQARRALRE